jgi:hypothetical protein
MISAAKLKGLGENSVDSVYLKGEEAILEHEKRNGYDKAFGRNGVERWMGDKEMVVPTGRHVLV